MALESCFFFYSLWIPNTCENLMAGDQYKTRTLSLACKTNQASSHSLFNTPADALKEDWPPLKRLKGVSQVPEFLNSQGETPGRLEQHVEDSFLLSKGARLQPSDTTIDSTAAGEGQSEGERSSLRQPRSGGFTPWWVLFVSSKNSLPVYAYNYLGVIC